MPLLLGGLIGLALLVLLFFWRGAKRARKAEVEAGAARLSSEPVALKEISSPAGSSEARKTASASAGAAGPGKSSATSQTDSSKASPGATDKNAGEDQEREVFEL